MQIVLDSNILFSALIKDSITRKIILEFEGKFLFPAYILEELENHKLELLNKSGLEENEFNFLLSKILTKMQIVQESELLLYRNESISIMQNIDLDDSVFIACALAHPNSLIWSDDKDFLRQSKIKIISTKEMVELFLDSFS